MSFYLITAHFWPFWPLFYTGSLLHMPIIVCLCVCAHYQWLTTPTRAVKFINTLTAARLFAFERRVLQFLRHSSLQLYISWHICIRPKTSAPTLKTPYLLFICVPPLLRILFLHFPPNLLLELIHFIWLMQIFFFSSIKYPFAILQGA